VYVIIDVSVGGCAGVGDVESEQAPAANTAEHVEIKNIFIQVGRFILPNFTTGVGPAPSIILYTDGRVFAKFPPIAPNKCRY
jgi:hypothetical protein